MLARGFQEFELTLFPTNPAPAIKENFELYGLLLRYVDSTPKAIANILIALYRGTSPSNMVQINSTQTATDGTFSFNISEPASGQFYFRAVSTYVASNVIIIQVTSVSVQPTLSLSATFSPEGIIEATGFLLLNNLSISNMEIRLFINGVDSATGRTDLNGHYIIHFNEPVNRTYDLEARFAGAGNLLPATSAGVKVSGQTSIPWQIILPLSILIGIVIVVAVWRSWRR